MSDRPWVLLLALLALGLALPGLGAPLRLEGASFRRAAASPRVGETAPALGVLGGTLHLFVRNPGPQPVTIESLLLEGVALDDLLPGQRVNWWRIWPQPVPAGGLAAITINARRPTLQEGGVARVEVGSSAGSLSVSVPLHTCPVRISHVTFQGLDGAPATRVAVFLRNDHPTRTYRVDRLYLDRPVTAEIRWLGREIPPGHLAIATLSLRPALASGQAMMLRAQVSSGGARAEVAAPLRAFAPVFPIGTWNTEAWRQEQELAWLAGAGIDHLVGYPNLLGSIRELGRKYGVRAIVDAGSGDDMNREVITGNLDNPDVTAWMRGDEPDTPRFNPHPELPQVTRTARQIPPFWQLDRHHPVYDNYCRDRTFAEYAPLPDITSMDAYRVGAPMPDDAGSPYPWGNYLELAGTYTEDLKLNSEPIPAWVWSQGIHAWTERLYVNGQLARPVPTPSECKVQLYQHLGRGAKGIWWFRYFPPERARADYRKDIQEEAPALLPLFESVADRIVGFFQETEQAIRGYNRQLIMLRPFLLQADVARLARVRAASNPPKLDAATVVGERAVFLFVTNLDYQLDPLGYRFAPQRDIVLAVSLPSWLRVADAFALTPQGPAACAWKAGRTEAVLTIPELLDGAIYVLAADLGVRREMQAALLPSR